MTESIFLTHILAKYGYVAIAAGTFLEGETVLVLAGMLAHQGILELPLVMLSALGGSLAGDQIMFLLGRQYGTRLLNKRPLLQQKVAKGQALVDKYGWQVALVFRFVYGMRTAIPVFLGISGMPVRIFVVCNCIGAVVWSILFAMVGYALGGAAEALWGRLGAHHHAMMGVLMVAVVLIALGIGWRMWKKALV